MEEKTDWTIVSGNRIPKEKTTVKTMDAKRRQWTAAEVSRTGLGVTNPGKPRKECGGFQ